MATTNVAGGYYDMIDGTTYLPVVQSPKMKLSGQSSEPIVDTLGTKQSQKLTPTSGSATLTFAGLTRDQIKTVTGFSAKKPSVSFQVLSDNPNSAKWLCQNMTPDEEPDVGTGGEEFQIVFRGDVTLLP